MATKRAIDQLPSLPQVLVKILDAIHSDSADYQSIADIIRHDPAVATRLIAVANSSYFGRAKRCESIERALLFLGTEAVKTIVITASIKQFFNHFKQGHNQFLRDFWRRSLISANFAQVLATLTSYPAPDEAYLCGLLTDVGQLMLLTSDEKPYLALLDSASNDNQLLAAEQSQFALTHCALSGELVDSWDISAFMADAVRYHHEPVNLIRDAHHLVKIVNLASLLSADKPIDDNTLAAADALFGLNENLTRELCNRISADVDNLARGLGIDISNSDEAQQKSREAHHQLGERLGELGELAQVNTQIWQAQSDEGLRQAVQRSLFLTFGITHSTVFLFDPTLNVLRTHLGADAENTTADFTVPVEAGRSLVSDALMQGTALSTINAVLPLNVVDRQLLRFCQAEVLICWPLKSKQQSVGVLVLGVDNAQIKLINQRKALVQTLCREFASAIAASNARFNDALQQNPDTDQFQQKIKEAVHEASNPLSIIRNYLETLRIKLGDDHSANEGLQLIKEEIDRVGTILLRLRDPEQGDAEQPLNINKVIESTAFIFRDSLCATRKIELTLSLDPAMTEIKGDSGHLKQILTNLIKNAAEELPPGGKIHLSSEASVSFGGRDYVAFNVDDNGQGINEAVKAKLFSPVTSTKGDGHSGLGLSIVKKLVDEMEGTIVCRSHKDSGTKFQILLPQ